MLSRAGWFSLLLTFAALFLGGILGCGTAQLPTLPDPDPAPQPSPTPDPLPNWPATSWRWGAWDLYGSGWTQPTVRALSKPGVLRRLAIAGVNYVGARPGPQNGNGPDGYVCDEVLAAMDATIASAESYNLTVEVALFDIWLLVNTHHENYSCDPSWSVRDFQGDRMTGSQVAWLERLAPHTQSHKVELLDANEAFKAKPSLAWFRDLKRHVRRLWPGKRLGTNAENRLIEREADFVEIHQDKAVGIQSGKPTGVNETGPISCLQWAKESQYARRLGTWYDLWRGDMSDEEWEACLVTHADIRKISGK